MKTQLILDKIADTEQVEVDQSELVQWLMQQAPRYGMSVEQFANALAEAGQVGTALADVRRGKALAVVMQNAKIVDASGNTVDISALDAEDEDPLDDIVDALDDEDDEIDDEEMAEAEAFVDAEELAQSESTDK